MFVPVRPHLLARRLRGAARDRRVHRRQALVARPAREWDRLALRDGVRPDFHVLTGNDLAIDMVMYGSDYLLGLSALRARRRSPARPRVGGGRPAFHELNDLLQYLGGFAFRAPVPAYRHDAAHRSCTLRGWIDRDAHPARRVRRTDPTAERDGPRRHRSSASAWRARRECAARPGQAAAHARRPAGADLDELGIAETSASTTRSTRAGPWPSRSRRATGRRPATVGNRFAILPMEGWDGTTDGRPTDLVRRRWRRFGAERRQARLGRRGRRRPARRPGQPEPAASSTTRTVDDLAALRHGAGRRPPPRRRLDRRPRRRPPAHPLGPVGPARRDARAAHRLPPPVLDRRVGAPTPPRCSPTTSSTSWSTTSSPPPCWPARPGFDFVDVKHCHGYLLPRAAVGGRPARPLRRRPRRPHAFLRDGRRRHPHGAPPTWRSACGSRRSTSCRSARRRRRRRARLGRRRRTATRSAATAPGWASTSPSPPLPRPAAARSASGWCAPPPGSPYYNPHVQRPAYFPPSDGYRRPRTRSSAWPASSPPPPSSTAAHPDLVVVGSGYSYLQEWLPTSARHVVRTGGADVGRARPDGCSATRTCPPTCSPGARSTAAGLPHLQRLHHGAPQRPGVGLLPARRLLQGATRAGRARRGQASRRAAQVRR